MPRASPPKSKWKRWLLWAALSWVVVTVLPVACFRFIDPPTTAFMLAHRLDDKPVRQTWVPLEKISTNMQRALIAAEDQKFPEHFGFDVKAIEDAMEDRLEGKSSRGASTLTQQVAKNLFLWSGRNFLRKGLEVYFTVLIELLWSKARILEVHLNIAEYGDGIYGVETASRVNFGKSAASLTREEAALLVVVLPSPKSRRVTAPGPKTRQRANWVLEQMTHVTLDRVQ